MKEFCVGIPAANIGESRFLPDPSFFNGRQARASGCKSPSQFQLICSEVSKFLCSLKLEQDFFDDSKLQSCVSDFFLAPTLDALRNTGQLDVQALERLGGGHLPAPNVLDQFLEAVHPCAEVFVTKAQVLVLLQHTK